VGGLTWSPDGRFIAFDWIPALGGGSRLAIIRVGSGEPKILEDEACAFFLEWSPDSSRILCSKGGVLYTIAATEGASVSSWGKSTSRLLRGRARCATSTPSAMRMARGNWESWIGSAANFNRSRIFPRSGSSTLHFLPGSA